MKYTNKYGLPERVIRQLSLNYQPKEGRISITQLIDSPLIRTLYLERWDDIIADYSDYLQAMLGVALHERQDKLAADDEQSEQKLEVNIDGWTVVGKADNLKDGIIRDTKTTRIGYLKFNAQKLEAQLNCYAWLWRRNGKEITGLEADLYYKDWDWKRVVFNQDRDYPSVLFQNITVNLWTFEQQEQFVKDQLHYHTVAAHNECSDEDKWKGASKFCIFKSGNLTGKSMRNLDSYEEAEQWIRDNNKKGVEIVERTGGCLRCEHFCSLANGVCPYFRKK